VDEVALYSYALNEEAIALLPGGTTEALTNKNDKPFNTCMATPNPFNPTTKISFNVSKGKRGYYAIYNCDGKEMRRFAIDGNLGSFIWNGKDQFDNIVATGVYVGILVLNNNETIRNRLILMK